MMRLSPARAASLAVALLFITLTFQLIGATGHLVDPSAGASVKAYHLGILAIVAVVILRGRVVRWPQELLTYLLGMAVIATMLGLITHPRTILANAVMAVLALVGAAMLGRTAGAARTVRAARWGAALVLAAVLAKLAAYHAALLLFFAAPHGHPNIPSFAGGGLNLEATWVALATALFIGTRWLVPYAVLSVLVSGAYASRGSILATLFVIGLAWLGAPPRTRRRWGVAAVAAACVGIGALGATERTLPGVGYVIERFQSIGEDPGSLGRLALWRGGFRVFADHPLGVGLGNALPAVRAATMTDFAEDNLHNLYLQHLVETGLPGLGLFGLLVAVTVLRLKRRQWRDPLLAYVVAYFALATLQFRGWEPLPWFVYGLWVGSDTPPEAAKREHHGDVLMSAST